MKLLIALGTLVFAALFAAALTTLASVGLRAAGGSATAINNQLAVIAAVTFLLGWLLAFSLARKDR